MDDDEIHAGRHLRAARQSSFRAVAEERYGEIVATGTTISWPEMRAYLEHRVAGRKRRRPTGKKLGR